MMASAGTNVHRFTYFKHSMSKGPAFMAVCFLNFHWAMTDFTVATLRFGRNNDIGQSESLFTTAVIQTTRFLSQIAQDI
ncbi:hypothetical protein DSCO28_63650 [Desulfosarcina ovata subsp. sediminis]|uniref:Uncharacterized protein n=1 Tax=Desulfosarcina ovata subsp. sediminis TaxID=885957 RepID=A0A5K7ZT48_9BACT|nr:hypothetical protein [Desulfosarcina ovata]BBO79844.1 hypothetical protein DSCO28_04100 [Desulfosarcina ovata subsp. sediminis]BBO82693.1 hypothetical protein DSCO28_32590 [Desulfosarcina ovata subsp. sediminis]BBO83368.1 hypothetical protein DSCO28_39340 [Desulfosarcina ovata subsp. sediminis]BBO83393.1 hypothetical protein DSCO28_39590 [Desulfosarcina ovata subsp. sediminis]BBO83430.1 hypothetical protein DSCO28_39960 [Desulfosarcina ovata subsp. sediminis]